VVNITLVKPMLRRYLCDTCPADASRQFFQLLNQVYQMCIVVDTCTLLTKKDCYALFLPTSFAA
jgi:hypothetical protein